jgi:hypothetical protein
MSYTFDHVTSLINVSASQTTVDCQALYSAIAAHQASEVGIVYDKIAIASGLNQLGENVQTGVTVELLGSWQIKFAAGNYVASVIAGNLIGGLDGDPIAYSAGVQVLLIQSASSTVVTSSSSGLTDTQAAQLTSIKNNTSLIPALL